MKLDTLRDLYIEELRDLYSAEKQILQALPKMVGATATPQLKSAFEEHEQQTFAHVQRLEQIFQQLGVAAQGKFCKGMQGVLAEGEELMRERADAAVRDAGLISAAQRVEHYEMAGYGTVRTYARLLGDEAAANLLQQTLDEEGEANKTLMRLAESLVNEEAAEAGSTS